MNKFLIYGANGFTGTLIARKAVDMGFSPILAGRSTEKLKPLAEELRLPYHIVSLDEKNRLRELLQDVPLVLHCAGPFIHTALPMAEACLDTSTHYLDVTGEWQVFESLAELHHIALKTNIMLLPGVGFDVVATDCLAYYLANLAENPLTLELAFTMKGKVSHGTAITAIEHFPNGSAIRKEGKIIHVPPAHRQMKVDFGPYGTRTCIAIPWGDISMAYHSTGIPNITVFATQPPKAQKIMRVARYVQWLLKMNWVQKYLKNQIKQQAPGPDETQRKNGFTAIWGKVIQEDGQSIEARWFGPEVYTFTAEAALHIVNRVLQNDLVVGFCTPSQAYGSELAMSMEGTTREDLSVQRKVEKEPLS